MFLKCTSQETSFGSQTDDDYDCEMRMREEKEVFLSYLMNWGCRREKIYERMTFYKFFVIFHCPKGKVANNWGILNFYTKFIGKVAINFYDIQ